MSMNKGTVWKGWVSSVSNNKDFNISHRGINVDQHSKPRNKCKYSIKKNIAFFRGLES
jgi:hypothetical protein